MYVPDIAIDELIMFRLLLFFFLCSCIVSGEIYFRLALPLYTQDQHQFTLTTKLIRLFKLLTVSIYLNNSGHVMLYTLLSVLTVKLIN